MSIYIKVNGVLYPAAIDGKTTDPEWDGRRTKTITLEKTYAEALALLPNGTAWSIVQKETVNKVDADGKEVFDAEGNPVEEEKTVEWDNSEYSLSGAITDRRDGTVSVKMGKPTEAEALAAQLSEIEEAYDNAE